MIRPATRDDTQAVADVAVDSGLFPADDAGTVTTMMADYFATKRATLATFASSTRMMNRLRLPTAKRRRQRTGLGT